MTEPLRFPYRVTATSSADALEAAKAAARAEGWRIVGVGRVEFVRVGQWVVTLSVRPRTPDA